MTEDQSPSVDELSGWRELLDGLGQLTVAWQAIEQSRLDKASDEPVALPGDLLVSITRAAHDAAEVLAGLADLVAEQGGDSASLTDAQREAAEQWADAHRAARD